MQKTLDQLVERLRRAHGDDLVSVILYGSAATPAEHDPGYSDLNVLCVLKELTPKQLAQAQPVFHWWRGYESLTPLMLAESELPGAADCFAIEFRDMQQRRQVLFGKDVVADMHIDPAFYRVQVEYELRAKLLRLRQKAAAVFSDRKLLGRLLLDSVTSFCVFARHALLLQGIDAPLDRRAVLRLAQEKLGIDAAPFATLLDVREKKAREKKASPGQWKPAELLATYLRQIERMIEVVDNLGKGNL